jgi:hypothetical protein
MKKIPRYIESLKSDVIYEVGECAEENFEILDNAAETTEDMWFHVQGFSSCHVIAKIHNMKLEKKHLRQIITQGCMLAKQYSRYSYMSNLVVIFTRVKNVRKTDIVGRVVSKEVKSRVI